MTRSSRFVRGLVIALALVMAPLGSAYAGCWSAYNQELAECDKLGGFTEIGCNADATYYYLACVADAATS